MLTVRYFGKNGKLNITQFGDDANAAALITQGYTEYPSAPPSPFHTFDSGTLQWVAETPAQANTRIEAEADLGLNSSQLMKLYFSVFYNLESRLRVIESQPAITRPTYKQALINLYKTLT